MKKSELYREIRGKGSSLLYRTSFLLSLLPKDLGKGVKIGQLKESKLDQATASPQTSITVRGERKGL